ncbi:putative two-component membrane permease complex subunit [Clostridium tepidiprofundi DSM 19306]|uniref:Putative two-component membrane permease complex subunit n=1 Tax=Clostridium tepidiprofundi DSM 19306 TaxID=1121338 RepID=A0A151ATR3_9CLOT|nr:permease [Clostridium tepidiprofundi]KYH30993.1 putative two-component membrane permease complex subunit [Clostridium tepidiprofundi DSM 19306]
MFNWLYKLISLLVENVFRVSMETRLGSSIHFFFYDTIKIIILLGIMIFAISYIRSYFPLEKTKKILERFDGNIGNVMAALLGIVTPFCSCSSVPLFIGFVEAGIPLGVTFSFLITSPIVNEAAFAILLASFGVKVAVIYVITGVVIGTLGGIIIGKFKMENHVEEYVYKMQMKDTVIKELNQKERFKFAIDNVKEIVGRVWIFLIIGIALGAVIHGYAPAEILSKYAGPNNPFAVFVAVVCGIPLYSNALGTIPIAEALINKGVGIGTALAFMMAVTALSLPEMILLRKVIKPKLIATFVIVTGIGIVIVGYLFNIFITGII